MEFLKQADRWLFKLINNDWSNGFFDIILPFLRNQYFWVPVYLFLIIFAWINFGKRAIWWVLFVLATFAITDMTSTQIFKPLFQRPRPCMDMVASQYARMLIPCSRGFSFVSNHAANHFGLSIFLFMTLKPFIGKWAWLAIFWAMVVCYAQVYVGAHFPLDVTGGALFGIIMGGFMSGVFRRNFGLVPKS